MLVRQYVQACDCSVVCVMCSVVCVGASVRVCNRVFVVLCVCLCACVRAGGCMYVCVYMVRMCIRAGVCVYMVRMCVCGNVCVCVCAWMCVLYS